MMSKIRLGVSRCLLGDMVRYDGQHKRDAFIMDTLGPLVELFIPVCGEGKPLRIYLQSPLAQQRHGTCQDLQ